jgi:hypothetical protein
VPDTNVLYSPNPVQGWGIDHPGKDNFDGTVYSVEIVGDTVYAGGRFANALRSGHREPRSNLMAVRRSTGELLPFAPQVNGTVRAVASDGVSLYIGGEFTSVNGVPATRLAKLNLATGVVDPTFLASTPNVVRDLLVVGNRLYVVGEFGTINGTTRHFAGAVNKVTGGLDPAFDPDADGRVYTVAISPDHTKLYLGGNFLSVDGTARAYLAAVDPASGDLQGPAFSRVGDVILDLNVRSDGSMVYGAGGGGFNSAAAWDAKSGSRRWTQRSDGDTQAVVYSNGHVYMGFHDGFQGDTQLRLLALDPDNGTVDPSFMPVSGSYPGVLTLDADGSYLVAGGWFPRMGGWGSANGLSIHPR